MLSAQKPAILEWSLSTLACTLILSKCHISWEKINRVFYMPWNNKAARGYKRIWIVCLLDRVAFACACVYGNVSTFSLYGNMRACAWKVVLFPRAWCSGKIYNCEHNQPDRSVPLDAAIISSYDVHDASADVFYQHTSTDTEHILQLADAITTTIYNSYLS